MYCGLDQDEIFAIFAHLYPAEKQRLHAACLRFQLKELGYDAQACTIGKMVRVIIPGFASEDEAYEKTYNRIVKYEDISDKMEIEIAQYLEKVCDSQLSEETMTKIHYLMRAISELESVGDACYNLARIFHRVKDKKESFTESQMSALQEMMKLTDNALAQMIVVLRNRREDTTMKETYRIENEINQLRDQIKSANVVDINDHKYNYYIGTAYIDLVNECERLGDYVVNVVESKFSKM